MGVIIRSRLRCLGHLLRMVEDRISFEAFHRPFGEQKKKGKTPGCLGRRPKDIWFEKMGGPGQRTLEESGCGGLGSSRVIIDQEPTKKK